MTDYSYFSYQTLDEKRWKRVKYPLQDYCFHCGRFEEVSANLRKSRLECQHCGKVVYFGTEIILGTNSNYPINSQEEDIIKTVLENSFIRKDAVFRVLLAGKEGIIIDFIVVESLPADFVFVSESTLLSFQRF